MEEILSLAAGYVARCKEEKRFPNFAGFCLSVGKSMQEVLGMREKDFEAFSTLLTVLEDAAWNSAMQASLLSVYLKLRLLPLSEGQEGTLAVAFEDEE